MRLRGGGGENNAGEEPKGAPGAEPTPAADAGGARGHPDNVWRDHRELEGLREELKGKGYTYEQLREMVRGNQGQAQPQTPPQAFGAGYPPPTSGDEMPDEYDLKTLRMVAQMVAPHLENIQKTVETLRKDQEEAKGYLYSERLDREAQQLGTSNPIFQNRTMQKLYSTLRDSDPDMAPAEIVREISSAVDEIHNARLKAAVAQSEQPTPGIGSSGIPGEVPPKFEGATSREQMKSGREMLKDWVARALGSGT